MKQTTLTVLTGLALSCSVQAASFDCTKAQSQVEKLICGNKVLLMLDDDLAVVYTSALRLNNKAASVRQGQKQWLKDRNSCTDADCLKDAYAARIQKLSLDQTTGYRMLEGNGYTICEEMFKRMNEELARKPQGPVCGYDVLRSIPGVTLPDWTPLDLHEHKALYKRHALARRVDYKDSDVVFAEPPPKAGQALTASYMPTEEMLERDWLDAIADKVAFYQWANAWPTQEDTDLMLIDVWPGTEKQCSSVGATLFDAALKKPRGSFGWAISLSRALPFQFAGRHYQMKEIVHSTGSNNGLISWEFSINWVSESTRRREYGQTNICHVRRNRSL